jgi:MFS family permease
MLRRGSVGACTRRLKYNLSSITVEDSAIIFLERMLMEDENTTTEIKDKIELSSQRGKRKGYRKLAIILGALFGAVIAGIIVLATQSPAVTQHVRDIFIILLALQMFVIGVALIVLIIQLATLTNLLQNEVKPILHSTTDTVNTLKGTVKFLSDNMTDPVIKLNSSIASLNKIVSLFKLKK